ncbi:hypothetical protein GCM10023149_08500 [Mucilaginibacter gynuensis]|uniref:DUF4397 domain-containing protein n=1 Tax=Mucilaginibacter gynuensis TaxID=1302236 RepID=A0ABP8FXC4_9SPHI
MKSILQRLSRLSSYTVIVPIFMMLFAGVHLTGCKKDGRLFTHVDSVAAVPPQFHFFNAFTYDTALTLSVDGLPRENVKLNTFSKYYSTLTAFNPNAQQPSSKLIVTYNPRINSLFRSMATIAFKPNTSYMVFPVSQGYDVNNGTKASVVPSLVYYPEEVYHPGNGYSAVRFLNLMSGYNSSSITVTPNTGAGTNLTIPQARFDYVNDIKTPSETYSTTKGGNKVLAFNMSGYGYNNTGQYNIRFTFLPVPLEDGKSYSVIATGDMKNFLTPAPTIEPQPQFFIVEDGHPESLEELAISTVTFPGNSSTMAEVRLVHGAYNLPNIIFDPTVPGSQGVYTGINVQLNQATLAAQRWPIVYPSTSPEEDTTGVYDWNPPSMAANARFPFPVQISPGSYKASTLAARTFSPTYNVFNYDFQENLSYTICLVPRNDSKTQCNSFVMQNDRTPDPAFFKLRVINLMGGLAAFDLHTGSPSGPVIAAGVPFGQATDYQQINPTLVTQDLYITDAGKTTLPFQTAAMKLPFKGGNSGTIYVMGLLPGTRYTGEPKPIKPFVHFISDAYATSSSYTNNTTLYYKY